MKREEAIVNVFEKGPPSIFHILDKMNVPSDMIRLIIQYGDVLIHTEESHYKFWTWQEEKGQIKYIWGKITATSPASTMKPDTKWDAREKQKNKLNKGYIQIGWARGT
jgi:hypothetical protein